MSLAEEVIMDPDQGAQIVAIIPAAGKGSRLSPFPAPKELFPVGYQDYEIDGHIQKRPKVVSQYLVENIVRAGAKKLFIILGEDKHDIMKYYGDGKRFGVDIAYLFQEKLHGMPQAINLARNWVGDHTAVFGMPDTIIEPDDAFLRLLTFHREKSSDLTLGLFKTAYPSKFGMADIDEQGNVTNIVDKPVKSELKYMWGCACWTAVFTRFLDEYLQTHPFVQKETLLGDVFLKAIETGLVVKGLPFDHGQYMDIGTADELDLALKKFHL
jgi:glucose-1-phosphate thymidylyltransferase